MAEMRREYRHAEGSAEIFSEPLKDSFPSLHRSLNPIRRPIYREEGVAAVLLGRTFAFAEMQVRRDGRIAVMREVSGDLLRRFVPAGQVMDHHDPGVGAGSRGSGSL